MSNIVELMLELQLSGRGRQKVSSDFPKPHSASSGLQRSPTSDHANRMQRSKRLCLLHAPTPKSSFVPVLMLPHSLLPDNSSIHVREYTSASCKSRMHSCADHASPSEVSFPYLYPFPSRLFFSGD